MNQLHNADTVRVAAIGFLKERLQGRFEVPAGLEDCVVMDVDTGVPQPATVSLSTLYIDTLEDLMGVSVAWAGVLAEVRDDLEMELKNSEARYDALEYKQFLTAAGSVENRKKLARIHPEVQSVDFDRRMWAFAHRKVETLTDRLDKFVAVLKYAHRRTQERASRAGTVYGSS